MDGNILQDKLDTLLKQREFPKTICPSEAPRSLSSAELKSLGVTEWRELMPKVRSILWKMREQDLVEILQKGEPVPMEVGPEEVRGPIRARRTVSKT